MAEDRLGNYKPTDEELAVGNGRPKRPATTILPLAPMEPKPWPAEPAPADATLAELFGALRGHLYLDDEGPVLFSLAVGVSAELDGDPLWGMLVGASSGGKTEPLRPLEDRGAYLDTITAPALLSWRHAKPSWQPTGVLWRMGPRGLLIIADFSTILATSDRGGREELFAALRRVYDGSYTRDVGNAPGPLHWQGRCTVLAAVTPTIDNYSAHADELGPRWLYYRLRPKDADAKRAAQVKVRKDGPQADEHRAKARAIANRVVAAAVRRASTVKVSDEMAERIFAYAAVTCLGRGSVPRDGYGRREILGLAVVEEPPRVTGQLLMLARCLLALQVDEQRTRALTREAALSSMPLVRRRALEELSLGEPITARELSRRLGCHKGVAQRTLEDLQAIGVADCDEPDEEDEEPGGFPRPKPWFLAGEDTELIVSVLAGCPGPEKWELTPLSPREKEEKTEETDKEDRGVWHTSYTSGPGEAAKTDKPGGTDRLEASAGMAYRCARCGHVTAPGYNDLAGTHCFNPQCDGRYQPLTEEDNTNAR